MHQFRTEDLEKTYLLCRKSEEKTWKKRHCDSEIWQRPEECIVSANFPYRFRFFVQTGPNKNVQAKNPSCNKNMSRYLFGK